MVMYVDNRAGSKQLVELPPLNKPFDIKGNPIGTHGQLYNFESDGIPGDVYFYGNGFDNDTLEIGVEVKSLTDLLDSIDSGRLTGVISGQIPRMLAWFDVTYLIYYGEYRASTGQLKPTTQYLTSHGKQKRLQLGKRPCPFGYINAVVNELQLRGVVVLRVNTIEEVAHAIGTIYRWWDREDHKLFQKFNKAQEALSGRVEEIPDKDFLRRARVANQLLEGIGFKRAKIIAAEFNDIVEMVNVLASDTSIIASVKGIGPVIAESLKQACGEAVSSSSGNISRVKRKLRQLGNRISELEGKGK